MSKSLIVIAGLLLILSSMTGCQATPTAVGLSDIPVFPGSRLESSDEFGAMMGDSLNRLESYTSKVWNFKTAASADEILEYYKSELPDAEVEETDPAEFEEMTDEELAEELMGRYSLWIPIGNPRSDEDYTIEIGEGWFTICETLKG